MSRLEWHEIHGWFSEADAAALGKLCDRVADSGRIVEIGPFCGRSTVFMAHRTEGRGVRILTVDNFKGGEPDDLATKFQAKSGPMGTLPFLMANLEMAKVDDHVQVLVSDSPDAAKWLCGLSVDLVFLDGNHHPDAVIKDVNAWRGFDCVAGPARTLCGHDANGRPGKTVRERFGDRMKQEANVWWVQ